MISSTRFTLLFAAGAARQRLWFEERLADWLLREGWRGLLWWQWLAVPIAVALALTAGYLLGWLTRRILGHVTARTNASWDDQLLTRLTGPITAVWAIGAAYLLSRWMVLGEAAEATVDRGLHAGIVLVLFWAALRAVDFPFQFAAQSPWGKTHAVGVGLLPLGRKVAKVVVVAMGVIAFLTDLGYPVASLLAGLGIGGLALALAAQKTVENLFGSVSIGADQPFRVGDFVRIDNILGNVESVGLRSTRIRTLDRTLVSIPNGKLADMRTETFAPRDRIRLACTPRAGSFDDHRADARRSGRPGPGAAGPSSHLAGRGHGLLLGGFDRFSRRGSHGLVLHHRVEPVSRHSAGRTAAIHRGGGAGRNTAGLPDPDDSARTSAREGR